MIFPNLLEFFRFFFARHGLQKAVIKPAFYLFPKHLVTASGFFFTDFAASRTTEFPKP